MIPIFDGHNDMITRDDATDFVAGREGGHIDLARARAGGLAGGIFAIFSDTPGYDPDFAAAESGGPYEIELAAPIGQDVAAPHATRAAGALLALERAGHLRIARRAGDLDDALHDGVLAAVMHLEGAEAIDAGLEALELWHAAGLRSLGPVWSRHNAFAHGVPFAFPASPDTGPGLTEVGTALVRRCALLGIAVDLSLNPPHLAANPRRGSRPSADRRLSKGSTLRVRRRSTLDRAHNRDSSTICGGSRLSHLNEAGFWDVARLDVAPLIASHSGAHALSACTRNLTDAQIDAIGASGGLVGIVFAVNFVRADGRDEADTPLAAIVAHARHVADRIGADHVALGSDFDGATIPAELGDVSGLPRLLDALCDGGFSDAEVRAIAWDNWRRVLARAWGE